MLCYFSHHVCQRLHRDTLQHDCYSYITWQSRQDSSKEEWSWICNNSNNQQGLNISVVSLTVNFINCSLTVTPFYPLKVHEWVGKGKCVQAQSWNHVSLISENTDKQGKAVPVLLTSLLFSRLPTVILKPWPPSTRIPGIWHANGRTGVAHLPQFLLTDVAQKKTNKSLIFDTIYLQTSQTWTHFTNDTARPLAF